jgi:5'-deoxynucleotidase YfbR-like HD superfamily hydrolase
MNKYGNLHFIKRTRRLAAIERCSNTPHIQSYSVAQHSFFISLYTKLFADLENKRLISEPGDKTINTLKAIEMAMMHDLEECVTGDLLYPFKHGVGVSKTMKENLSHAIALVVETHVNEELFKELPEMIRNAYIRLWRQSKTNGVEGLLVEAMDKFEILVFSLEEMDMGNMQMQPIFITAMEILLSRYNQFESLMETLFNINNYYKDKFINDCCRKEGDENIDNLIGGVKDEIEKQSNYNWRV